MQPAIASRTDAHLAVVGESPQTRATLIGMLRQAGHAFCQDYPIDAASMLSAAAEHGHPPDLLVYVANPTQAEAKENLARVRALLDCPILLVAEKNGDSACAGEAELGIPDCLLLSEATPETLNLKVETLLTASQVLSAVQDTDIHMQRLFVSILTVMVKVLESKDPYTRFHSHSVATWARLIGRKKGLSDEELIRLGLAAVFHDFGKIGIPEDILNKPQALTKDEFAVMRQHPLVARDLLSSVEVAHDLLPAITHHH